MTWIKVSQWCQNSGLNESSSISRRVELGEGSHDHPQKRHPYGTTGSFAIATGSTIRTVLLEGFSSDTTFCDTYWVPTVIIFAHPFGNC
jgi:hypothetical protein